MSAEANYPEYQQSTRQWIQNIMVFNCQTQASKPFMLCLDFPRFNTISSASGDKLASAAGV
jgi:hypothetical protein